MKKTRAICSATAMLASLIVAFTAGCGGGYGGTGNSVYMPPPSPTPAHSMH